MRNALFKGGEDQFLKPAHSSGNSENKSFLGVSRRDLGNHLDRMCAPNGSAVVHITPSIGGTPNTFDLRSIAMSDIKAAEGHLPVNLPVNDFQGGFLNKDKGQFQYWVVKLPYTDTIRVYYSPYESMQPKRRIQSSLHFLAGKEELLKIIRAEYPSLSGVSDSVKTITATSNEGLLPNKRLNDKE